jgi:hypothetical protein
MAPLGKAFLSASACADATAIYRELIARGIAAQRPFVGNACGSRQCQTLMATVSILKVPPTCRRARSIPTRSSDDRCPGGTCATGCQLCLGQRSCLEYASDRAHVAPAFLSGQLHSRAIICGAGGKLPATRDYPHISHRPRLRDHTGALRLSGHLTRDRFARLKLVAVLASNSMTCNRESDTWLAFSSFTEQRTVTRPKLPEGWGRC